MNAAERKAQRDAEKAAAQAAEALTSTETSTDETDELADNEYRIEATGKGRDNKYWAKITKDDDVSGLELTAFLRSKNPFTKDEVINLAGITLKWEA